MGARVSLASRSAASPWRSCAPAAVRCSSPGPRSSPIRKPRCSRGYPASIRRARLDVRLHRVDTTTDTTSLGSSTPPRGGHRLRTRSRPGPGTRVGPTVPWGCPRRVHEGAHSLEARACPRPGGDRASGTRRGSSARRCSRLRGDHEHRVVSSGGSDGAARCRAGVWRSRRGPVGRRPQGASTRGRAHDRGHGSPSTRRASLTAGIVGLARTCRSAASICGRSLTVAPCSRTGAGRDPARTGGIAYTARTSASSRRACAAHHPTAASAPGEPSTPTTIRCAGMWTITITALPLRGSKVLPRTGTFVSVGSRGSRATVGRHRDERRSAVTITDLFDYLLGRATTRDLALELVPASTSGRHRGLTRRGED